MRPIPIRSPEIARAVDRVIKLLVPVWSTACCSTDVAMETLLMVFQAFLVFASLLLRFPSFLLCFSASLLFFRFIPFLCLPLINPSFPVAHCTPPVTSSELGSFGPRSAYGHYIGESSLLRGSGCLQRSV